MERKFIFSQNGLMHFLLMWYMSICNVTCQLCPAEFNDGYMESSCTRVSGSWCYFYCNPGFVQNGYWLTCGENGKWSEDTNSICIKSELCPAEFNDGYMESSCTRVSGTSCIFYSNPGFYKNGSWLSCGENGKWNRDTNSICIKSELCPAEFNDGYMESSCTRVSGTSCIYYCNPGFYKNGSWLSCGENGKWNRDTNSICIKSDPVYENQKEECSVMRAVDVWDQQSILNSTLPTSDSSLIQMI